MERDLATSIDKLNVNEAIIFGIIDEFPQGIEINTKIIDKKTGMILADETVYDEKILKLEKKRGFIGHYATSAKTGKGVTEAFQVLIKELYNEQKKC